MCHILRSKRVYEQVLIVLLLLIGFIPDNIDGLKCSSCDGANCAPGSDHPTKDCPANEGYCFTFGNVTKKDCILTTKAECIKAKGDCYNPASDSDKTKLGEINTCIGENTADHISDQGSTCVCNSDLCNAASATATTPSPGTGTGPGEGEGGDISCYVCSGGNSSACWSLEPLSQIEQKKCQGCELRKTPNLVTRKCADSLSTECAVYKFPRGCYNIGDTNALAAHLDCVNDKIKNTKIPPNLEANKRSLEEASGVHCYCDADLCNPAGRKFSSGALLLSGILLAKIIHVQIHILV